MTLLQRAVILLTLAGAAGLAGIPVLAIMFTVAGLLVLDLVLISGLVRLIRRRKE